MIKLFAPLAVLALLPLTESVEAKTCPTGKMWRVSLGICQSKAANLKYYHGGVKTAAKHETTVAKTEKAPARAPRSEVASLRRNIRPDRLVDPGPADDAGPLDASPSADPAPVALPSVNPTPFGALPSVSSFR
jgi:hypothetical protein